MKSSEIGRKLPDSDPQEHENTDKMDQNVAQEALNLEIKQLMAKTNHKRHKLRTIFPKLLPVTDTKLKIANTDSKKIWYQARDDDNKYLECQKF